jgi:two-component system sensor histidine kinase UhpB
MRVNLKTSLVLRVAAVATLTSVAVAYLFLARLVQEGDEEVARIARIAERHVGFQVVKLATGMGLSAQFPDWQPLADHTNLQGLCVAYRNESGVTINRTCITPEGLGRAPGWFSYAVRHTLKVDAPSAQPVGYFEFAQGQVVVSPEPEVAIARLWRQGRPVLELLSIEVLAVTVLAWFAVAAAVRPTGGVLAGLARMAEGDLSIRLPPSRITEVNSIVGAVNQLASRLRSTLADRADLAHRLVDAHEAERRNLARELHDELAQCLSAISAKAALISMKAGQMCPALVSEAEAIGSVTSSTLTQLRDTLVRLRPPEIDELGLLQSLRRMLLAWGRDRPDIECRFEASGSFFDLPMPVSVSLYRIAQECLTNVARHADASRVTVSLARSGAGQIELRVVDDGHGAALEEERARLGGEGAGLGVVGMRERVAALQGRVSLEVGVPHGLSVNVSIPVPRDSCPKSGSNEPNSDPVASAGHECKWSGEGTDDRCPEGTLPAR